MANRRDPHWFKWNDAPQATATGDSDPVITKHLKNVLIQVGGTFVANLSVKTRLDASLEYIELTTLSGPGFVAIPNDGAVNDVIVSVSSYTSGTIKAILVGRTSQE